MNRNFRRILAASVSIPALTALPVLAAETNVPTFICDDEGGACVQEDTAPADATVDITLTISDEGTTEVYGSSTNIDTTAEGLVRQHATATDTAELLILNEGSASIRAHETITTGISAAANAEIDLAIYQYATAPVVVLEFDNTGSLNLGADATADGIDDAEATATRGSSNNPGILQDGEGDAIDVPGSTTVNFDNDGEDASLTVSAVADAEGGSGPGDFGEAYAINYGGLWQYVGSSRVDLQACKLEYSIVSPK